MSTGNVFPVPQQQFCDVNGKPYALGTLTFYAAGTTNPQDTYFNSDLAPGHANANPLALDASGRALVYFQPLGYRVILKDVNGVTVYDQDNVYGVALGSDVVTLQSQVTALLGASGGDNGICEGRLTLTTGTPVTITDVTAATTIYFTPYKGSRIALYSGTAWAIYAFAELSASIAGFAASTPFDVFAYNNAGTVAIETLAWTNDTTRATALTTQNGVYVKSGATTRRYLGTFRTTGTIGQTEDSLTKRYVWNYANRIRRNLFRQESTSNWSYTTLTLRQANANTANQVELVVGVAEASLWLNLNVGAANTNTTVVALGAIGEDSTTASTGTAASLQFAVANVAVQSSATLSKYPAVGRHYYAWLEESQATGTTTWYGTGFAQAAQNQSGLVGWIDG